jgi:hypothetical protein
VKQFLVEVFVPRSRAGELAAVKERVSAATTRLSRKEADVRYLRAIYVPEDETCFYVFEASSAELVAQANALAGLRDGRILETFDGSAAPAETEAHEKRERLTNPIHC